MSHSRLLRLVFVWGLVLVVFLVGFFWGLFVGWFWWFFWWECYLVSILFLWNIFYCTKKNRVLSSRNSKMLGYIYAITKGAVPGPRYDGIRSRVMAFTVACTMLQTSEPWCFQTTWHFLVSMVLSITCLQLETDIDNKSLNRCFQIWELSGILKFFR